MITENLSTLKIHKLTQAQYDNAVASGTVNENELYLTPYEEVDLTPYATIEQLNEAIGKNGIYVQNDEPIDAEDNTIWLDLDEDLDEDLATNSAIYVPSTAAVGQTIVVKSIDENGKPTELECVDPWILTDESTGIRYKMSLIDGKLTMTEVAPE